MVANDCIKYDIPFLVEPMSYPLTSTIKNPVEQADIKSHIVIETARDITALPIDILKAEFPGDVRQQPDTGVLLDFCRQLDEASQTPWVILSQGVDFEQFLATTCLQGGSFRFRGKGHLAGSGKDTGQGRTGEVVIYNRGQQSEKTGRGNGKIREAVV